MPQRTEKLNELLKHEISGLILRELDFSKDTIITVTAVETSPDLKQAEVRVSIMPSLRSSQVLRNLNFKAFNIQKLLNKKIKMRIIPKIIFEIDKSELKTKRIDELLKDIK